MTNTRKTTRIASIVLTLAMLLSLICAVGTVTAGAAADRVSLYCSNVTFSRTGAVSYEAYVQTRDNAKSQEVYIHYYYTDTLGWQDAKAEFVTTLDDGSKIWKATFCSLNTKYAIKYIADGVTYWDNNNGRDYNGSERIGTAPVTAERLGFQYYCNNNFRINAVLQNYAYHKNVFVRYTTDGWNSYRDQSLRYDRTNGDGTETWTTSLGIDINDYANSDRFQYAICYSVNGRTYWANNFGANYGYDFSIRH